MQLKTAQDSHLEKGLNLMIAEKVALPRLLITKGVFTQQEWNKAVEEVQKEINEQKK